MAKYVCSVCGYVHEGDQPPEKCPQCGVGAEKFIRQGDDKTWAAEHVVGVAQGAPEDIMADLRATAGKFDLAKRAKALDLDAIHDTVHEMARDEARHGKAFEGLLKRYFG